MLAKVCSAAVNGIEAYPVALEVNAGYGDTIIVMIVSISPSHPAIAKPRLSLRLTRSFSWAAPAAGRSASRRESAPTPSDPPTPALASFHTLPDAPIKPLEELFRAKVINLLVEEKLLPPARVQVLYSWKHSGFNVHAGDRVAPEAKADLEDLAQHIRSNPFSVEKMTLILRVWHVDPLRCPVCQNPMRVIAVIDDPRVVEKILRHVGAWHDPAAGPSPPDAPGPYT